MIYVAAYLIIGTIFMLYMDIALYFLRKSESEFYYEELEFTNMERLRVILKWPIALYAYIQGIVSALKNKKEDE
jgi:hypothetical protein